MVLGDVSHRLYIKDTYPLVVAQVQIHLLGVNIVEIQE